MMMMMVFAPLFQNKDNHKRNQYNLESTWTCYSLLPEGLSKVVSSSGIFSPFNLKAARLMWHPCLHDSFSSISSHPETNTARVHFPRYWSETRQRPMLQDQTWSFFTNRTNLPHRPPQGPPPSRRSSTWRPHLKMLGRWAGGEKICNLVDGIQRKGKLHNLHLL